MLSLSLLNAIKFLAYISPFLLGFTFILIAAMNGTPLPAIIYFGILALSMFLLSLITISSTNPLPSNYNELCKTWGWNFFSDAYYRPSLGTYFIVFTLFYTLLPMILHSNVNYFFLTFMLFVFILDLVINFGVNKCYQTSTYFISIFAGLLIGGLTSPFIASADPSLVFFGSPPSNNQQCGMVSKKNFKCLVYKNGQLIKQL